MIDRAETRPSSSQSPSGKILRRMCRDMAKKMLEEEEKGGVAKL